MLKLEELKKAIDGVKPLFTRLQQFYCEIPATDCRCEDPGICCAFIPEMTMIEALQWLWVLQGKESIERNRLIRHFIAFYLTNPLRHHGCPFLDNGSCTIYEFRTFACRAYGLWSQKMGVERTRQSRETKKALLAMWKRYGVDLPSARVLFEIDYCRQVKCVGPSVSDEHLMNILQKVYALDHKIANLQTKFENEYHSDFSFLITSLVLGQKKALLSKFAVIKELCQEGTENRLANLLAQIKPDGIFPTD